MASFTITPSVVNSINAAPITLTLVGTSTAWTGTPFTLSGGTGASIVSQTVTSATAATVVVLAGTAAGTITLTDTISAATQTFVAHIATSLTPVSTLSVGNPTINIFTIKTAISGTSTTLVDWIDNATNLKVYYQTKGANSTAVLNGSMDGTNWYLLQSLSTGINTVVTPCDRFAQLVIVNASGASVMTDVLQITSRR